ncbi:MAG: cation:proton antiporter [Ketobacter sp.]|nr:cation:proton antiporter [Ketobacter sp.]
MEQISHVLTLFGGLFLISLVVTPIAKILHVPRVTLLILSGVALGPHGAGLLNGVSETWFPLIADITLLIIGYLLGARLTKSYLNKYIGGVLNASLVITLTTVAMVITGLLLAGFSLEVAVLLGSIAAATDPAATLDVLHQRKANSYFSNLLQGIVALDDVLGLLIFSLALAALGLINQNDAPLTPVLTMLWDIGGALLLGGIVGGLLAFLLNKRDPEQSVIVESLGFIFLCGGLSIHLEVSFLLAAMTMGLVVVNTADATADHLHEIEDIEQPFLLLFFVMAGATLNLDAGAAVGVAGLLFIVLRALGRYLGGCLCPSNPELQGHRRWLGVSLLPQAGVAMGMALVGAHAYPQHAGVLLSVAIAATVIFEVTGPVFINLALDRVDERP